MDVYVLEQEFELGKRKISNIVYDRDAFILDVEIFVPYVVIKIDELTPDNKLICKDLSKYATMGKYYVGTDNQIYQVEGWTPPEEKI